MHSARSAPSCVRPPAQPSPDRLAGSPLDSAGRLFGPPRSLSDCWSGSPLDSAGRLIGPPDAAQVRDILSYGVEEHIGARVELENLAMQALTYDLDDSFK